MGFFLEEVGYAFDFSLLAYYAIGRNSLEPTQKPEIRSSVWDGPVSTAISCLMLRCFLGTGQLPPDAPFQERRVQEAYTRLMPLQLNLAQSAGFGSGWRPGRLIPRRLTAPKGCIRNINEASMSSKKTVHEAWLQNPAYQRAYAQEALIQSAEELLLEWMETQGVGQSELARRLGKSRSYVSQLFSGSRNMTLRTLADICWALRVEPVLQIRPLTSGLGTVSVPQDPVAALRGRGRGEKLGEALLKAREVDRKRG
jgi:transcriptional regulator with XRE-family HTH domain